MKFDEIWKSPSVATVSAIILLAIFNVLRGSTLNYWVQLPAGPEKAAKQGAGGARSTNARDTPFRFVTD